MRASRPVEADLTIGEARRLLSRVGFLETLPAGELEDLARRSAFSRLPAGGTFVVGPEEHAERMLLVLAGQVQVYDADPTDRELTLSVLEGGSFVGATGLASRRTRELRVRALEPSLLCRLGRGDLEALVLGRPEAGLALAGSLATRLVWMEGRWADLAAKEVTARLAGVLLMLVEEEGIMTPEGPMIPTRYTHRQLSSMIGANREATTRAFRELQEIGGVELRSRYVHVTDPEALRHASG